MSTSSVKQLPKATVELEINIPKEEVKAAYEKIMAKVAEELELPGFRKGKVPKELVEKNTSKSKVYEEVVKEVIPKAYEMAIRQHNLAPITSPKIELAKAKEGEDWLVKVTIALKPKVDLKNYKEKIRELKKSKTKIWTPGSKETKEEEKKTSVDELIKTLLVEIEVELSDLLIMEETNRLLTNLIDQTQKLGLTMDQYLQAKGKTSEHLRTEYAKQAEENLKIEFAIAAIADKESITVTQEDLDKLISKVEKPEEREKLQKDSYYLAHLIRQQKTLEYLNNL